MAISNESLSLRGFYSILVGRYRWYRNKNIPIDAEWHGEKISRVRKLGSTRIGSKPYFTNKDQRRFSFFCCLNIIYLFIFFRERETVYECARGGPEGEAQDNLTQTARPAQSPTQGWIP